MLLAIYINFLFIPISTCFDFLLKINELEMQFVDGEKWFVKMTTLSWYDVKYVSQNTISQVRKWKWRENCKANSCLHFYGLQAISDMPGLLFA